MKFGKVGQVGLVSAIALVVATLFTACGNTLTVGFMFVPTNNLTPGQIEVYEVDSESGSLRTIPTSPFPSGGRDPIAEATSPDFNNLYVINEDDNNIVQFGIGTDGKLYPQSTINTPGSFPMATAMNTAGSYLYVVDTLQPIPGCSLTNACPGDIAAYAVTSTATSATAGSNGAGSLGQVCSAPSSGTPTCTVGNPVINSNGQGYLPLQLTPTDKTTVLTPTAVNVLTNGNFVYVTAFNASTSLGYLFSFSVGANGTLSPLNGGLPVNIGAQPAAIVSDAAGQFVYIADELKNAVSTYAVNSDGSLSLKSIASTGNQPTALTMDSTGKFLYVTNASDGNVSGYTVSNGTLTNTGTYAAGSQPVAIAIDPRHVGFLYTVNFLGSNLNGYQIDPTTGVLNNAQQSPYASTVQPTAIAGIPHGGITTAAKE
ncbi:lactonase family protein [Acidicapsa ligni]|uniref:lactonase family protein n=1 Tax=Acidicapsa ligni TaxID=542300 RepID=UPI0021DFAF6E|nr:beta-propeller fold lactonase family protein [Acidicapsa ligni]